MLKRIQERPADQWMSQLLEDGGIVGGVYQTTQEALTDPDIVANGHVIDRPDGGVQLGPLARLVDTPASPAARGDQTHPQGAAALAYQWQTESRPTPEREPTSELPLKGIKVVELATIIAAPIGASFLADMGADVIKVEQIGGDPFRTMLSGLGAARVNAGKRSTSVNLKTPEGKALITALMSDADVIIHNYRPGVPERLGIGYEQIAAINPRVIYLQSNGYGPDGPSAERPSTHPVPGAAMGGVMYQMGGRLPAELQDFAGLKLWTSRIMRANELNPDPNTGLVVATSVLLGLAARQRTGRGQQIYVDMFGANAYANSDDFLNYPEKPPRLLPDAGLHGLTPTYRLYPCADEQWVFLALLTDAQIQRFCETLTTAGHTPPPLALFSQAGEGLQQALGELLLTQTATTWQTLLTPQGVACVRADGVAPNRFWLEDSQAQAMDLTTVVEHPQWGSYQRHGPLVMFDGACQSLNPPPLAGQHNREIFSKLGYSNDQLAELNARGILWQEDA